MQLFQHTRKNTGTGIYATAVPATRAHIGVADAMVGFMDGNGEEWAAKYGRKAWAIAHGQVTDSTEPLRIFVVHKEFLGERGNYKSSRFKDRRIFNAQIIDAPKQIKKSKPERRTVWNEETHRRELKLVDTEYMLENTYRPEEGCMSFAANRIKKIDRKYAIRVRYQYPRSFLGFKWLHTVEEDIEGLKAHVFQHEIEHFEGKNIYHACTS